MEQLISLIAPVKEYITTLDWSYIFTFIIICYGINHFKVAETLGNITGAKTATKYRVVLIGLGYGTITYFWKDYTKVQAEILFQSFIFALVFHKLIIETVLKWLAKNGLPVSISKHLFPEEKIKAFLKAHQNGQDESTINNQ